MAGLLDDYMRQQQPGLLGWLSDNSDLLTAMGAGLLGGKGMGGAMQLGLAARQGGRDSKIKQLMLQEQLRRDERDFAFRQQEAQRAQGNTDRSFGLQREQLDQGRLGPGWVRGPDGSAMPIPRGPADPAYMREAASAKNPTGSFEDEQKLRKEFEANAKPYMEVRRGYERLLSSKDDAAGDMSLIFGFMKMLDPGSVVREGEFANAQNTAGVPDRIRNLYNRALSGERLSPTQRAQFKGQAEAVYKSTKSEFDSRVGQFKGIATRYGIDPGRVIPDIGPEPSVAPPAADPISGLPAPPPGYNLVK